MQMMFITKLEYYLDKLVIIQFKSCYHYVYFPEH
jgi:hypothetical protein